ncbi:NHL domain-containing protein [Streptomyces sp. NPDC000963]
MSTPQVADAGGEGFVPLIRTVAGSGTAGFKEEDGELAVSAQLNRPYGVAVDSAGVLYFSDHLNHRVRRVTADGKISTVAGSKAGAYKGDNGPAISAQLNSPREIAVDGADNLYIADDANHRIRRITPDGTISTVAGTGSPGFSGDGGPATSARLQRPIGVAVDSTGNLYLTEYGSHRVRKVTTDGKIGTIAGNGTAGSTGDGGPATSARLNTPYGMALDADDNLYIAEYNGYRIRKITPDGTISTVVGKGTQGTGGDGGPATSAQLHNPIGVVVDSTGSLYISEYNTHRVRKVAPDGTISTLAGTGTAGPGGDDGPATTAQMKNPFGLAVDGVDTLYIADHNNHRIRKITSEKMAGLPESGTVVSWANTRSRLRIGVHRESLKNGAPVHQTLASPRAHQKWRLIATGQADGQVLYRIENLRSGKVLGTADAQETAGAPIAQRDYEGAQAQHQHWRLTPMTAETDTSTIYEVTNHHSGLLLHTATNAPIALTQQDAEGDPRSRQWQLLPA